MNNWKCECGAINFAEATTCKRCQLQKTEPAYAVQLGVGRQSFEPVTMTEKTANPITQTQGVVLIVLLCVIILLSLWSTFRPQPKYEYKAVSFLTGSTERTGEGAAKFTSVNLDEDQLAAMGGEGWELVDSFLEIETAWPNFGSAEYVMGLQPNVRPQKAVLLFKRQR